MKQTHAAALAAALVAAIPAWGQSPPARPDVMTLTNQDGKPAHACKVLRTYKHPAGGTAYEVRDEVTGEVMTVIENAHPDDVKASLKAEPVTETPKPTDPILAPKSYSAPKVQQQFVDEPAAKPAAQYSRPPVPATRRWLGWMRPVAPAKPMPTPSSQGRLPGSGDMVAAYHPDPVIRLIGSMTDDLLPSMREVSAEALAREGNRRPEVVEAMIRSAKTDLAPSVRACCCRCLAEMQVRSPECLSALQGLEDDREQSVRTAAAAARTTLEQP
jgi:hypothetical protein